MQVSPHKLINPTPYAELPSPDKWTKELIETYQLDTGILDFLFLILPEDSAKQYMSSLVEVEKNLNLHQPYTMSMDSLLEQALLHYVRPSIEVVPFWEHVANTKYQIEWKQLILETNKLFWYLLFRVTEFTPESVQAAIDKSLISLVYQATRDAGW